MEGQRSIFEGVDPFEEFITEKFGEQPDLPVLLNATREMLIETLPQGDYADSHGYLCPDGKWRTDREVAEEIQKGTEIGQAFVEMYLTGVFARNQHEDEAEQV